LSNQYYTASGNPAPLSRASSAVSRNESLLIQQAFDKLPNPSDIAGGQSNFYDDTGTPSSLVIAALDQNITDLTDGLELIVRAGNSAVGATTILAGSFPLKQVRSFDGTPVGANDFVKDQFITLRYDFENGWFQYEANSTAAAQAAAAAAAASAQTALNAPGTSATSTTSDTVATGPTTITVQPGKAFVVGMSVKQAITGSPTNWNYGDITAYNPITGVMTINVTLTQGSGAASNWTVSLSGPTLQTGISSGANYGTISADLTLTVSSPNVQGLTPQANGLSVILPDATTITAGTKYDISNIEDATNSASLMIKDSGGNIIGFLPPGVTTTAELMSTATPSGVWGMSNVDIFGTEVLGTVNTTTVLSTSASVTGFAKAITLSATRTLVVAYSSSIHAVVYDSSTRSFGTSALLRSSIGIASNSITVDRVGCLLVGSDKVLIVSCDDAAAGQAICITISGTSITSGAPSAITFSDTLYRVMDIQAYGASYVAGFRNQQRVEAVAMTISGTTVTSGSVTNIFTGSSGSIYSACSFSYNPTTVLFVYMLSAATFVSAKAATISGTAITVGALASLTATSTACYVRRSLLGNCIVAFVNTQVRISIITVSGTTAAFSTQLSTGITSPFSIALSNDQSNTNPMVIAAGANPGSFTAFNDVAGVPTLVGTAYSLNMGSSAAVTYVAEYSGGHLFTQSDASGTVLYNFAVTASTFALAKIYRSSGISAYTSGIVAPDLTYPRQIFTPGLLMANSSNPTKTHAISVSDGAKPSMRISDASLTPSVRPATIISSMSNSGRGSTNSESWLSYNRGNLTVEIQKVRLV
jgi:hypothetical protein